MLILSPSVKSKNFHTTLWQHSHNIILKVTIVPVVEDSIAEQYKPHITNWGTVNPGIMMILTRKLSKLLPLLL